MSSKAVITAILTQRISAVQHTGGISVALVKAGISAANGGRVARTERSCGICDSRYESNGMLIYEGLQKP